MSFTHSEKRVIQAMYQLSRPATINEIAKWADNMAWNTAEKAIDSLFNRGIVGYDEWGERRYWQLTYYPDMSEPSSNQGSGWGS